MPARLPQPADAGEKFRDTKIKVNRAIRERVG
jgi:hypothetical protein